MMDVVETSICKCLNVTADVLYGLFEYKQQNRDVEFSGEKGKRIFERTSNSSQMKEIPSQIAKLKRLHFSLVVTTFSQMTIWEM